MKRLLTQFIDWFLYTVLSEKRRQKIANLFSERQKEFIKRFTQHGKRHQQKQLIKKIRDNLYSLGMRQKALAKLETIVTTTKDNYLKRLAAWELTLWHINELTKDGAEKALTYIKQAANNEKDSEQIRRITIIEVECLARLKRTDEARKRLKQLMQTTSHPDLYLAQANLEEEIPTKLKWINKVYEYFNVQPITFTSLTEPTYDGLMMENTDPQVNESPKVSIIMPCYNAEDGVKTAIESLLSQTWQNIELLLVDDHSTDNTLQVLQSYAEKDSRIKVFQTPQNSGPYIARNIALQHAAGEFVTVNDADDWSHEKKIETQVRHLLANPEIIANTSAHARLTEDIHIYRRGTPGRYIFPNMSSIMFRRKPVLEKIGYWDSVRFAADGEFKRRLLRQFGEQSFVDLDSAPLSLPRQTVSSLTGSSAFGYNGFFMGVRKEYVESLEHFHEHGTSLYYPYPQTKRPFPVPEPMWPSREIKENNTREFSHIIAADFRETNEAVKQFLQTNNERLGLVQLYKYDLNLPIEISPKIRHYIDGKNIQMLVYGEKVASDILTIIDYDMLLAEQVYVPKIKSKKLQIVITKPIDETFAKMEKHVRIIFPNVKTIHWLPLHEGIRQQLKRTLPVEQMNHVAKENWVIQDD